MKRTQCSIALAFFAFVFAPLLHGQGTVSLARCDSSSITYRITHPLHVVEATSSAAVFRVAVDTAKREIKSVSASVDVMTFDSGNSNRDSHAMEVIDALSFPNATFTSSEISARHDTLQVGGTLVFHGVSKPARLHAVGRWTDRDFAVDGTFALSLTEFSVERPSMLMLPVEDTLRFSFHAAFRIR
jgi:polyisoprenoid-binding protein YceI